MSSPAPASILNYFRDLPDPRRETRNQEHREQEAQEQEAGRTD